MLTGNPELSINRIPLDVAGERQITQQCGYFHLWRFEDAAGNVVLDGEVGVTFGGRSSIDDAIPMTTNSLVQFTMPVLLTVLRWRAQPNRVAVVLIGPKAQVMEANNPPARQIVFQGQAGGIVTYGNPVGTSVTGIMAAVASRSRAIITAPITNSAPVFVGSLGVSVATGMPLEPGSSIVLLTSGDVFGVSTAPGQQVRILEERGQ